MIYKAIEKMNFMELFFLEFYAMYKSMKEIIANFNYWDEMKNHKREVEYLFLFNSINSLAIKNKFL